MKSNNIVGLKELLENMETYKERVNKGESITDFRRPRLLFRVSIIEAEEIGWGTVVDFTKVKKEGVDAREVLARLKKING